MLLVQWQAQHALQQPGVLCQMGVIDLGNFVAAVVIVVQGQQSTAEHQHQHDPP